MSIAKYLKQYIAEAVSEKCGEDIEEEVKDDETSEKKKKDDEEEVEEEVAEYDDEKKTTVNKKTSLEEEEDEDEEEIEEEISKFDGKTTKNKETSLEKATDGDEPKGKGKDIEDDTMTEEEDEEEEEEIEEDITKFDGKTTKNVKTPAEKENDGDQEIEESEEEEEVNEVTMVLPSDTALVALSALGKKANTMLTSKVKSELEKKGLVKGGKITSTGKALLNSPDAEDKLKEIGS